MWKFWNYDPIPDENNIDNFYERTRWLESKANTMPYHRKHYEQFDYFAVKFGRVGFCARGFVWACIGGVAAAAAFTGKRTEGPSGALDVVARSTIGFTLYILATIGIFSYATWRFFEGFYGLRVSPFDSTGMKIINGYVVPFASCIIYVFFGISNIYVMVTGRRNSDANITRDIANNVVGKIFLNVCAVVLAGVAFGWIAQLIKGSFKDPLDMKKVNKQPAWFKGIILATGYIGISGRILLFFLLAILLFRTTWDSEVRDDGFGGALKQLQVHIIGQIFLLLIAVCLIVFCYLVHFQLLFQDFPEI